VLPTDDRSSWDASLLDDPRVVNLWDRELGLSRWVAGRRDLGIEPLGPVVYDAFLLFGPDARWDSAPAGLLASGLPVIGESSKLASAVGRLTSSS
jgi:hypothetical protein